MKLRMCFATCRSVLIVTGYSFDTSSVDSSHCSYNVSTASSRTHPGIFSFTYFCLGGWAILSLAFVLGFFLSLVCYHRCRLFKVSLFFPAVLVFYFFFLFPFLCCRMQLWEGITKLELGRNFEDF